MQQRHGDTKGDVEDFLAHLDYIVKLVGVDHVGIASDSGLDGWGVDEIHYADDVLAGMDRWRVVARRLREEYGYSDPDLRKILGLNFERVLNPGPAQGDSAPTRIGVVCGRRGGPLRWNPSETFLTTVRER